MNTLTMGGNINHKNYASCSFDDREMLMLLKDLALDPCNVKPSKTLKNRVLKIRTLLKASVERPKRKRKFNQHENDSKLAATFGSFKAEKYDIQNAKIKRKGESSSLSLHSLESWGHSAIHEDVALSTLNDCAKCCSLSKMSHPMIKWNLKSHSEDLVTSSSCTNSTTTSNDDETNPEFWNDVSSEALHSTKLKEDEELDPPRFVIPIGPRYQAEVPRWEGATTQRRLNCNNMKWLGTQDWPTPEITQSNNRMCVRKGRPDSCSCDDPGSIDCVEKHINESRKRLELEIGKTFSRWKFDEMGKDVSKSWTLEEQKEFESLARSNLQSDETNFWDLARDHFPKKSMTNMINYYYNVYIPRRMSMETRSSSNAVDSDNDQSEVYKNDGGSSTSKMRILPICKFLKSMSKKLPGKQV